MQFLRKSFRKFTKPMSTYTVEDIPFDSEITEEIEKVFLDMKKLGLSHEEIQTAIHSLKVRNRFDN